MQTNSTHLPVSDTVDGRPAVLGEEAVAWLDRSTPTRGLNEDLLGFDGAASVRASIKRVLKMLNTLDIGVLVSRQTWLHRLTGADIEAKLRFELSVKQINLLLDELKLAAHRARSQLENMRTERGGIAEDQRGLVDLIDYATGLRSSNGAADSFVVDRFERRLGNLITMHRANEMAVAQFALAEQGLMSLLDRYGEIATVVVPLWQQHAFAVIHAPARLSDNHPDVANFLVCHSALEEYFDGEARL